MLVSGAEAAAGGSCVSLLRPVCDVPQFLRPLCSLTGSYVARD